MKLKHLILWVLGCSMASAQGVPSPVEASTAQVAAGTVGAGYYVSPRRLAAAPFALPSQAGNAGEFLTTDGATAAWAAINLSLYLPLTGGTMTGNIVFNDTGEGLTFHGGGTITGASGALAITGATAVTGNITVNAPSAGGGETITSGASDFGVAYRALGNAGSSSGVFGATRSAGVYFFTGEAANATVLGSLTATSLQFGTNAIIKQTIFSSGGVFFGTAPTDPGANNIAIQGGIVGTATNDAAAAGNVGQLLSAQLAAASATSLVTATAKTITSVSLTAGDWEVTGTVHFIPANTTVVASLIASVSTADNTQASADSVGGYASIGAVYTSGGATMSATPIPVRISLAATTPYYLVATGTFSISTCTAYGTIRARRVR